MRHPGFNKKDSDAPDYTPMADASAESARIAGDLGNKQLDFARQQYEDAKPMFQDIVDQQMSIADKTSAQGDDYYNYQKSYRPAEQAMLAEAMQNDDAGLAAYDAANQADAKTIAADDGTIYQANKGLIDGEVGTAMADAQGGYTRSLNQAMRQGMRYGMSNPAMIGQVGGLGLAQASALASTANSARRMGVDSVRQRAQVGLGLRQSNTNALNAQKAIGWAKKLDAAGLVKGMPGASQGAYGLAVSAGSNAGANSMAPGTQYQSGMSQGANTIMQGRQLYQNGLGDILDSQTGMASGAQAAGASSTGAAIGAVGGIAVAVI